MRVLYFTNMWPTPERPGFGAFVRAQAESVRDVGVDVDVLAMNGAGGAMRYPKALLDLRLRLRGRPVDVVHAHYGYSVAIACMQSATPVVGSFCGTDLYSPRQRLLCAWAGRKAAASIVKNEEMRRLLRRDDAIVLPNGVDRQVFLPGDRSTARLDLGLAADQVYVLFPYDPARRTKRHDLAAAAVRDLEQRIGCPASLLVVYDQPRDVYLRHLHAADVVVLTSAWEGSPNAIKEALACDVPVVSTPVGDVPLLVEGLERSRVVEASAEALGEALRGAVSSIPNGEGPARMRRYSARSTAERLLECYREVARRDAGVH